METIPGSSVGGPFWDSWYASLPEEKKPTLFELEMLLKGIVCFGNPRNHPGERRSAAAVAHDFAEELRILRDGIVRVDELTRGLLGDRDNALTFTRDLETVLTEDSARERLPHGQLTQETPEASLFVLRNTFSDFTELSDALLRLGHVGNRLYFALHGMVAREIVSNVFFHPRMALEFRPEFDPIRLPALIDALHTTGSETVHRVAETAGLGLLRVLRYLELVEGHAADTADVRRTYLILAALRSDVRALIRYLGREAGDAIADGFEQDVLLVSALDIRRRHGAFAAEAKWLSALRSVLETSASSLQVEVRKSFSRDLPGPSAGVDDAELGTMLIDASTAMRATVHHALGSLCWVLSPARPPPRFAQSEYDRRAQSERLRRQVWMFMQILRAFLAKAEAVEGSSDRWADSSSFQFLRDFLSHFRAVGAPLARLNDYPQLDSFLAALAPLRAVDLLETPRLSRAVQECRAFFGFLESLYHGISERPEVKGHPLDRQDATETLKIYLARG